MANTTQTITLSALIILGIFTAAYDFTDKTYFCEDRQLLYECNSFTQYYGLDNGKCINEDTGNKLCSSGWLKVEPGKVIDEVDDTPEPSQGDFICPPNKQPCYKIQ